MTDLTRLGNVNQTLWFLIHSGPMFATTGKRVEGQDEKSGFTERMAKIL